MLWVPGAGDNNESMNSIICKTKKKNHFTYSFFSCSSLFCSALKANELAMENPIDANDIATFATPITFPSLLNLPIHFPDF